MKRQRETLGSLGGVSVGIEIDGPDLHLRRVADLGGDLGGKDSHDRHGFESELHLLIVQDGEQPQRSANGMPDQSGSDVAFGAEGCDFRWNGLEERTQPGMAEVLPLMNGELARCSAVIIFKTRHQ